MTCHADRFGRLPYLEREVHPSLLIDLETYAGLYKLAKTRRFDGQCVVPRRKIGDHIVSSLPANGIVRDGGRDVGGRYGCVRKGRSRSVEDVPT